MGIGFYCDIQGNKGNDKGAIMELLAETQKLIRTVIGTFVILVAVFSLGDIVDFIKGMINRIGKWR